MVGIREMFRDNRKVYETKRAWEYGIFSVVVFRMTNFSKNLPSVMPKSKFFPPSVCISLKNLLS